MSTAAKITSSAWWLSVVWALVRTGGAALVPFVPGLVADPAGTWLGAVLTVGLVLVVTVATSLAGLPGDGGGPWWIVVLQRGLRQFGQFTVGATAGAVLLSDLDWKAVLLAAAGSAASTVILAALTYVPAASALGVDASE